MKKSIPLIGIMLLLSACGKSQQDRKIFKKAGQFNLAADVYVSKDMGRGGIMLIKDWQNRAVAAYKVLLSCVTPGIPSMPNPMPSIGSFETTEGGRCYVYIKEYVSLEDLNLGALEKYTIEDAKLDEDFDPREVLIFEKTEDTQ